MTIIKDPALGKYEIEVDKNQYGVYYWQDVKNKKTGKVTKEKKFKGHFISLHQLVRWLTKSFIADSNKKLTLAQFIGEYNTFLRRFEVAVGLDEKRLEIQRGKGGLTTYDERY